MKYNIDFSGWVTVYAKSQEEAIEIFEDWVGCVQDDTKDNWRGQLKEPFFENDGVEEE